MTKKGIKIIVPRKLVLVDEAFVGTGKYKGNLYCGMNYWAAQEIGCLFPYPKNTAVVTRGIGGWDWRGYKVKHIFLHEQQESVFMQLGCDYPDAHARTTDLVGPDYCPPKIDYNKVLELVKA